MIFNVSPNRSATKSFALFCQSNGVKMIHGPNQDYADLIVGPLLEESNIPDEYRLWDYFRILTSVANCFGDNPWPSLVQQIVQDYPNAKYVFIERPIKEWIGSVRLHNWGRKMSFLEKFFYWRHLPREEELNKYTDEQLTNVYKIHANIAANTLKKNLSWVCLDDPQIGKKLAKHLNFSNSEFPRAKEEPIINKIA